MRLIHVDETAIRKLNPKILERARKEAAKSPSTQKHVCIALDSRGNIITAACNRWRSHSELRLVLKYFSTAKFYGRGLGSLVVLRVTKGGALSYSLPCLKCTKVLSALDVPVFHS